MSSAPDYTPVYQSVADRKPNGQLKNICFGLMAIGVAAIAYGLLTPGTVLPDPEGLDSSFHVKPPKR